MDDETRTHLLEIRTSLAELRTSVAEFRLHVAGQLERLTSAVAAVPERDEQ